MLYQSLKFTPWHYCRFVVIVAMVENAKVPIMPRGNSQQSDRDTPPKEKATGTPIALNALTIVPIVRL